MLRISINNRILTHSEKTNAFRIPGHGRDHGSRRHHHVTNGDHLPDHLQRALVDQKVEDYYLREGLTEQTEEDPFCVFLVLLGTWTACSVIRDIPNASMIYVLVLSQ